MTSAADVPFTISRRGLLTSTSLVGAAGVLGVPTAAATPARGGADLVETSAGWVRGRRAAGISAFLGIPYGGPTGGANRFRPPTAPRRWRGVRDATRYGHIAPQPVPGARLDYTRLISWLDQPGGQDEDCLVLNVWTPRPDGARRPVLVSFHGGGFSTGSGNHRGFDGDPLARFGDVVVVTVNHRLGLLGFLHLADLGAPADWASAGVNGMLDAVAALRWVRENIANFGGDPGNVMVFGQSGGGAKTSTLLAMPSAKGLLHRAAVQSGSTLTLATREAGTRNASRLLARLGLSTRRITELRDVPARMLVAAQAALEASTPPAQFSPVVDGAAIPRDPFSPTAPEVSRDVPMIVSLTRDEATAFAADPELTDAGLLAAAAALAGQDTAARVVGEYRDAYPQSSPALLLARMSTDSGVFVAARTQAERKVALGGAPAFMYLFTWPSPADPARWGAPHGIDVALAFHNANGAHHGRQRAACPPAGRRPGRRVGPLRPHRRPERPRPAALAGLRPHHAPDAGPRRHDDRRERPAAPVPAAVGGDSGLSGRRAVEKEAPLVGGLGYEMSYVVDHYQVVHLAAVVGGEVVDQFADAVVGGFDLHAPLLGGVLVAVPAVHSPDRALDVRAARACLAGGLGRHRVRELLAVGGERHDDVFVVHDCDTSHG
jgi:para-nitrobenzyl esterase